jgi:chitinase
MYKFGKRNILAMTALALCSVVAVTFAEGHHVNHINGSGNTKALVGKTIFSPYKDVGTSMNWWDPSGDDPKTGGPNTYVMSTVLTSGGIAPVAQPMATAMPPEINTVTWAFATGDCTNEDWAGMSAKYFTDQGLSPTYLIDKNVASFVNAKKYYILSTGGAAGSFTCSDPDAMKAFIAKYNSPYLLGLDLDIEGGHLTTDKLASLIHTVKVAKEVYPKLRISFTLATLAASDDSKVSLNDEGTFVVETAEKEGLEGFYVNLMVMDYGYGPSKSICVTKSEAGTDLCDMGKSAIQAVENLSEKYSIPYNRIEVTPLIGVNDIPDEIFTLQDAELVAQYVKDKALAGYHYWSYDRDTPCAGPNSDLQTTCNNKLPPSDISLLSYTNKIASYFN